MVSKYIANLLYNHECVVVPGFGGFIRSNTSAFINKVEREIYPPSSIIAFNASLSSNDGLLASYIATAENISFREANVKIENWVIQSNNIFKQGETVKIEKLGELLLNDAGNIEFSSELSTNFNITSYGMQPIRLNAIDTTIEEVKIVQPKANKQKYSKVYRLIPETLKWAAVLAPFIAFTLWGSMNKDVVQNYVQNYSGMFSWVKVTPGKTADIDLKKCQITINTPTENPFSPGSILADVADSALPAVVSYKALQANNLYTEEITTDYRQEQILEYQIIGGAFRDNQNAMSLVESLQKAGFNASIVDTTPKGLIMVSIQGASSILEAREKLADIKISGYKSAWIYKMKKS